MAAGRDRFELFAFESVSDADPGAVEPVLLSDSALHELSGSLFSAALLPAGVVVLRQTPRGRHGPVELSKGRKGAPGAAEPRLHAESYGTTVRRVTWFSQRGARVTAMAFSVDGVVLAITTRDGGLYLLPAADLLLPSSPRCTVAVVDDGRTAAGLPSLVAFARAKIRSRSTQLGWCDDDVSVSVTVGGDGSSDGRTVTFQGLAPTIQVALPRGYVGDSQPAVGGRPADAATGAAAPGGDAAGAAFLATDHPTSLAWWRPSQAVLAEAVAAGARAQLGAYEAALKGFAASREEAAAPGDARPSKPLVGAASSDALAPAAEDVASGIRARMGSALTGRFIIVGHANGRVSVVDPAAAWRQLTAPPDGGSGCGGSTDVIVWTACLSPTGSPVERLQLHDDVATLRRFGLWSLAAAARYDGGAGPSPSRGTSLGSFSEGAGSGLSLGPPTRPVVAYPTRVVIQPAVLLIQTSDRYINLPLETVAAPPPRSALPQFAPPRANQLPLPTAAENSAPRRLSALRSLDAASAAGPTESGPASVGSARDTHLSPAPVGARAGGAARRSQTLQPAQSPLAVSVGGASAGALGGSRVVRSVSSGGDNDRRRTFDDADEDAARVDAYVRSELVHVAACLAALAPAEADMKHASGRVSSPALPPVPRYLLTLVEHARSTHAAAVERDSNAAAAAAAATASGGVGPSQSTAPGARSLPASSSAAGRGVLGLLRDAARRRGAGARPPLPPATAAGAAAAAKLPLDPTSDRDFFEASDAVFALPTPGSEDFWGDKAEEEGWEVVASGPAASTAATEPPRTARPAAPPASSWSFFGLGATAVAPAAAPAPPPAVPKGGRSALPPGTSPATAGSGRRGTISALPGGDAGGGASGGRGRRGSIWDIFGGASASSESAGTALESEAEDPVAVRGGPPLGALRMGQSGAAFMPTSTGLKVLPVRYSVASTLSAAASGSCFFVYHGLHDHKLRVYDFNTHEKALKEVLLPIGGPGLHGPARIMADYQAARDHYAALLDAAGVTAAQELHAEEQRLRDEEVAKSAADAAAAERRNEGDEPASSAASSKASGARRPAVPPLTSGVSARLPAAVATAGAKIPGGPTRQRSASGDASRSSGVASSRGDSEANSRNLLETPASSRRGGGALVDASSIGGSPRQGGRIVVARRLRASASVSATSDVLEPLPPSLEEVEVLYAGNLIFVAVNPEFGASGAASGAAAARVLVVSSNLAQRALDSVQRAERLLGDLRAASAIVTGIRAQAVREDVNSQAATAARSSVQAGSVSAFAAAQYQIAQRAKRVREAVSRAVINDAATLSTFPTRDAFTLPQDSVLQTFVLPPGHRVASLCAVPLCGGGIPGGMGAGTPAFQVVVHSTVSARGRSRSGSAALASLAAASASSNGGGEAAWVIRPWRVQDAGRLARRLLLEADMAEQTRDAVAELPSAIMGGNAVATTRKAAASPCRPPRLEPPLSPKLRPQGNVVAPLSPLQRIRGAQGRGSATADSAFPEPSADDATLEAWCASASPPPSAASLIRLRGTVAEIERLSFALGQDAARVYESLADTATITVLKALAHATTTAPATGVLHIPAPAVEGRSMQTPQRHMPTSPAYSSVEPPALKDDDAEALSHLAPALVSLAACTPAVCALSRDDSAIVGLDDDGTAVVDADERHGISLWRCAQAYRHWTGDILPASLSRAVPALHRALRSLGSRAAGGAAASDVRGLLVQAYTFYALAAPSLKTTKALLMLAQAGRPDLAVCFAASALGYAYEFPRATAALVDGDGDGMTVGRHGSDSGFGFVKQLLGRVTLCGGNVSATPAADGGPTPPPPLWVTLEGAERARVANILVQCQALAITTAISGGDSDGAVSLPFCMSAADFAAFLLSCRDYSSERAIGLFLAHGLGVFAVVAGDRLRWQEAQAAVPTDASAGALPSGLTPAEASRVAGISAAPAKPAGVADDSGAAADAWYDTAAPEPPLDDMALVLRHPLVRDGFLFVGGRASAAALTYLGSHGYAPALVRAAPHTLPVSALLTLALAAADAPGSDGGATMLHLLQRSVLPRLTLEALRGLPTAQLEVLGAVLAGPIAANGVGDERESDGSSSSGVGGGLLLRLRASFLEALAREAAGAMRPQLAAASASARRSTSAARLAAARDVAALHLCALAVLATRAGGEGSARLEASLAALAGWYSPSTVVPALVDLRLLAAAAAALEARGSPLPPPLDPQDDASEDPSPAPAGGRSLALLLRLHAAVEEAASPQEAASAVGAALDRAVLGVVESSADGWRVAGALLREALLFVAARPAVFDAATLHALLASRAADSSGFAAALGVALFGGGAGAQAEPAPAPAEESLGQLLSRLSRSASAATLDGISAALAAAGSTPPAPGGGLSAVVPGRLALLAMTAHLQRQEELEGRPGEAFARKLPALLPAAVAARNAGLPV